MGVVDLGRGITDSAVNNVFDEGDVRCGEDVERSARLNLSRENARRSEAEGDALPCLGLKIASNLLEGESEIGRSGDPDGLGRSSRTRRAVTSAYPKQRPERESDGGRRWLSDA